MFNMKKLIAATIVSTCVLVPLTSACAEAITDESSCKVVYTVDDPDYKSGSRSFIAEGAQSENISLISYLGMDGNGLTMTYNDWYRSRYVG